MANQKISELNSTGVGGLVDSDLFVVVDSSVAETKRIHWGALKIPPFIGAKVSNTVNSTGLNLTGGAVEFEWDEEVYDTHGFWSSASAGLLIIPPAFGGMYFDANNYCQFLNTTAGDYNQSQIRHFNAAGTLLGIMQDQREAGTTTEKTQNTWLGVLVNSGDYFQMTMNVETDTSVDVRSDSFLMIRLAGQ